MEKTIEEKLNTILALSREKASESDYTPFEGLKFYTCPTEGLASILLFGRAFFLDKSAVGNPAVYEKINTIYLLLLGLDKRDALDAEKEKSKRWESRAWKILEIVRRRETEQRPKTAAVLRTLREVSEKNEQLVATLRLLKRLASDINYQCSDFRNNVDKECYRALEAYKEGKKDE